MEINIISEAKKCLKPIAELLRDTGIHGLDNLYARAEQDHNQFINDVRRLFCGVEALNDITLHKKGKNLIQESDRLEDLRRELYTVYSYCKY